jgi:hypothetical protein
LERLYRLHDDKWVVQVYDDIDAHVPMLARLCDRQFKGYAAIGYMIEREDASRPLTIPAHPV